MRTSALLTTSLLTCLLTSVVAAEANPWVLYPGGNGSGAGKHIVFVTGDDARNPHGGRSEPAGDHALGILGNPDLRERPPHVGIGQSHLMSDSEQLRLIENALTPIRIRSGELRCTLDHGLELLSSQAPALRLVHGHAEPTVASSPPTRRTPSMPAVPYGISTITAPPCPPPMHADPRP